MNDMITSTHSNHDDHHDDSVMASRPSRFTTVKRSLASVLRTIAGGAAGWRQRRRGSFLVLVVGVLAILSVLAILYASIGTADRQRSSAIIKNEKLNEVPDVFADYLLSTIGNDRTGTFYDDSMDFQPDATGALTTRPKVMREVTDYPYTPYEMTSFLPTGNLPGGDIAFNPEGAHQPAGADRITRTLPRSWPASDPWLASLRPAFLDYRGAGPMAGESYHVNDRDWPHISNVSPSGMFINLFNLRPAPDGGGFDAPPGINPGQMSANLSLLEPSGDLFNPPTPTNALEWGNPADPRRPAHWDSRQVGAARPASEISLNPNDRYYALYQWADADGDGILDARWQELRFEGVTAAGVLGIIDLLPPDPRFRYVFAARIVDASGLVNVNTATDLVARPTALTPIGSSPAEVDLLGVLTMRNQIDYYGRLAGPARSGTYGSTGADTGIPGNIAPANDRENYSDYRRVSPTEDRPFIIGYAGYEALRLTIAAGTTPDRFFPANNLPLTGGPDLATDNLRAVFANHYGLNNPTWFTGLMPNDPSPPASRWDFSINAHPVTFALTMPAEADRIALARKRYYETRANAYQGLVLSTVNIGGATFAAFNNSGGWYDTTDAAELFARAGVNDLSVTSNLEASVDGRSEYFLNLGPMRSGRSDRKELLRDRRDGGVGTNRDGVVDRDASLQLAVDVRSLLTPFSGAAQLSPKRGVNRDSLSANEAAIHVEPAALRMTNVRNPLLDGRDVNGDGQADVNYSGLDPIFRGYADALAGFSDLRAAWTLPTPGRSNETDTLFYGHKGPALGLITAGAMTLNFKDSYDKDGVQSQYTLLLEKTYRATLRMELNRPLDQQQFPAWQDGQSLDLDGAVDVPNSLSRLADTFTPNPPNPPARAITLFGVEAQPFITQVATFTVYSDAPPSFNGDDDVSIRKVTIKGDVKENNHDLLYRAVAVRLTNPFDQPVSLSNWRLRNNNVEPRHFDVGEDQFPAIDREDNFYYIEIEGRYYKLASLEEKMFSAPPRPTPGRDDGTIDHYVSNYSAPNFHPPTTGPLGITLGPISIPARSSIVVYTLSQIPQTIYRGRFKNLEGNPITRLLPAALASEQNAKSMRSIIVQNMGSTGSGAYWIPEMAVAPNFPINDSDYGKILLPGIRRARPPQQNPAPQPPTPRSQTELFTPLITTGQPTVNLWRALRTPALLDANNVPLPGADDAITGTNPALLNQSLPPQYWDQTTPPPVPTADLLPHNVLSNDLLVDRFRIPTTADINADLPLGQNDVSATNAVDAALGYTLTMWATARRPSSPVQTPYGAIPAYCLEPKFAAMWNDGSDRFPNHGLPLVSGDFTAVGGGGQMPAGAPSGWALSARASSRSLIRTDPDVQRTPAIAGPPLGVGGTRESFEKFFIQPHIDNDEFSYTVTTANLDEKVSRLRVADMIAPLAVGPMYDPNQVKPQEWNNHPEYFPVTWPAPAITRAAQWTTLSEQLAMSLGYEEIDLTGPDSGVYALFLPRVDPAHNVFPIFDRGQLHLDQFAPYKKSNTNPNTPFDPLMDQPRGLRAPLALGIFDQFTTGSTAGRGGLTNITPGLININTAPVMNLRAVPMLSPAVGPDPRTMQPLWWWQPFTAPIAANSIYPVGIDSDIATTLGTYRDKSELFTRPIGMFPDTPILFKDEDAGRPIPPNSQATGGRPLNGRFISNNIEAINEQPGFASRGELLCARLRDSADFNTFVTTRQSPHNIDFAGFDSMDPTVPNPITYNNTLPGVSLVSRLTGALPADSVELGNEWEEKLTVAAGALGSTSVRSDVFICWFIIHGYQRSDCENLKPDQPLVPTIARRFMMVVDRSNVINRGDRPKVLLFKEVPM